MTDDLLQRILGEVRERKEAARGAFEESRRLEEALDALGPPAPDRASPVEPPGEVADTPAPAPDAAQEADAGDDEAYPSPE